MNNLLKKTFGMCVVVLASFSFSVANISAQTPEIEWVRQFGTIAPQNDLPQAIDAQGNIYIAGYYTYARTTAFLLKLSPQGNEIWRSECSYYVLYSYVRGICIDSTGIYVLGGSNGVVWKFNHDGEQIWVRSILGLNTDGSAICSDGSSIYVAGRIYRTSEYDIIVRRCDTDGHMEWSREFGTSEEDSVGGICADASGVYVAGDTRGLLPGQSSAGPADAFICKYDIAGNLEWTRQFGSNSNSQWGDSCDDRWVEICTDSYSLYIVGYTTGFFMGQSNPLRGNEIFVQKCDMSGNEIWTRQFGSPFVQDLPGGIDVDASGIYVSGYTSGVLPGQTNSGGIDAFVCKYDMNGDVLWIRQFGTSAHDQARAISVDSAGVYVTGPTSGAFPGYEISGQQDGFVRKYSTGGSEEWTRQFGYFAPMTDEASTIDTDGNVYIAGRTFGVLPEQTWAGSSDSFLRKYDAFGNEVWTRQFGTPNSDIANGLCVDESGIYVAGSEGGFTGYVRKFDFSGDEIWHYQVNVPNAQTYIYDICAAGDAIYIVGQSSLGIPGQPQYGGADVFLRKLDKNGNESWTCQYGSQVSDYAKAITTDSTGIYVSGYSYESGSSNHDCFLWKFAEDGSLIWDQWFGTDVADLAWDVCADYTGVYVAGYTYGALSDQSSHGGVDAFIRKFDVAGNEIWTRQFGGERYDRASSVDVDEQGIYITGWSPGIQTSSSWNAFVQAYSAEGNALWCFEFGTTGVDYGYGIAAENRCIYVVGTTQGGTFPGQTSDDTYFADVFVAKIHKPNLPPIAEVTAPSEANVGIPILFNASYSSDPDGTIVSYDWDFGDGATGSGVIVDHSYAAEGTYIITLTVTDDKGATATDTAAIHVVNSPPVAEAGPDQVIEATGPMTLFTLDGTASSDPDNDELAYSWVDSTGAVIGTSSTLSLSRGLGSETFVLTVTDPAGLSSSDSVSITIVRGSPANQLACMTKLIDESVAAGKIDPELETSIRGKVAAASNALARGNPNDAKAAMNEVKALINQVEAQTDKKIAPDTAAEIIAWANQVIADLGG